MSLLNKWTKKKEQEQLEAVEQKADVLSTPKKTSTKNKAADKTSEQKSDKQSGSAHAHAYRVLIRPMISEKATTQEVIGTYTFVVALDATKEDIKRAVETVYGVRPVTIRTAHVEGKRKRFGWRHGKRSDWKKALVTLPKGRTINIHEGV